MERARATARVEGVGRQLRQQLLDQALRSGTRLLEIIAVPSRCWPGCEPGIEAAGPAPLIGVDRNSGATADRADVHIAIVDMPGLALVAVGAAADEGGHTLRIPHADRQRK